MSRYEIKPVFVLDNTIFETRREAEEHVIRLRIHEQLKGVFTDAGNKFLTCEQETILGVLIEKLINDRVEFANILNPTTGWEDKKIEVRPTQSQLDEILKKIEEVNKKPSPVEFYPPQPQVWPNQSPTVVPPNTPYVAPYYPFNPNPMGGDVWCGGSGHAGSAWSLAVDGK